MLKLGPLLERCTYLTVQQGRLNIEWQTNGKWSCKRRPLVSANSPNSPLVAYVSWIQVPSSRTKDFNPQPKLEIIIIIIISLLSILSEDEWGDLDCLYKAWKRWTRWKWTTKWKMTVRWKPLARSRGQRTNKSYVYVLINWPRQNERLSWPE